MRMSLLASLPESDGEVDAEALEEAIGDVYDPVREIDEA